MLLIGKMLIDISKGIIMMIRYLELAVSNRPKLWSQSELLEKSIDLGFTKMTSSTILFRYHQDIINVIQLTIYVH